jgi:predicted nucleic acid-binding protein
MICIDTTVLIDEFRARGNLDAPVNRALLTQGAQTLIVPAVAAGEFLDGAAMVSEQRFDESLGILRRRRVVSADLETAQHYGRIVAFLRRGRHLAGRSQNDLWIAATARCHGAMVLTRNACDYEGIPDLEVLGYGNT